MNPALAILARSHLLRSRGVRRQLDTLGHVLGRGRTRRRQGPHLGDNVLYGALAHNGERLVAPRQRRRPAKKAARSGLARSNSVALHNTRANPCCRQQ